MLVNLGVVLTAAGEYEEAEAVLRRSISLVPEQHPHGIYAHLALADVLFQSVRLVEARTHIEVVKVSPPADEQALAELRKLDAALAEVPAKPAE